jgi:hypothetical protein
MNRDFKRRIAYEVLFSLGALGLMCLITRLWPLLFLVIPGILTTALRLLFLSAKRTESPLPAATPPEPPRQDTEQDAVRIAFGVLQRRIAGQVTARYPAAKWVWAESNATERFAQGLELIILLNRAGGFKKAEVQVHNLQFRGLLYENAASESPEEAASGSGDDDNPDNAYGGADRTDYSVLAFEWADANLLALNTRSNNVIAAGESAMLIPAHDLPHPDSWPDICSELTRNGFSGAAVNESGILVSLPE